MNAKFLSKLMMIALVSATFVFTACDDDDDDDGVAAGEMQATVGGNTLSGTTTATQSGLGVSVSVSDGSSSLSLNIFEEEGFTGVLDTVTTGFTLSYIPDNNNPGNNETAQSGSVDVTEYSDGTISATFSGTLEDGTEVTDGEVNAVSY